MAVAGLPMSPVPCPSCQLTPLLSGSAPYTPSASLSRAVSAISRPASAVLPPQLVVATSCLSSLMAASPAAPLSLQSVGIAGGGYWLFAD